MQTKVTQFDIDIAKDVVSGFFAVDGGPELPFTVSLERLMDWATAKGPVTLRDAYQENEGELPFEEAMIEHATVAEYLTGGPDPIPEMAAAALDFTTKEHVQAVVMHMEKNKLHEVTLHPERYHNLLSVLRTSPMFCAMNTSMKAGERECVRTCGITFFKGDWK